MAAEVAQSPEPAAWDFIEAGEPKLSSDMLLSDEASTKSTDQKPEAIHHSMEPTQVFQAVPDAEPMEIERSGDATKGNANAESLSSPGPLSNYQPHFTWLLPLLPRKWQGLAGKTPPAMTKPEQIVVSSLLAFVGILLVAITDYYYLTTTFTTDNDQNVPIRMLSGAYAATAVLVYEAYQSPLAQPRNVVGGFFVTAVTGVSTRLFCQEAGIPDFVAGALSLAIGLAAMNLTKTVHPPGGACALLAVIGGKSVHALGYGYVLTSTGGAFVMVAVAVLGNNLVASRQYPLYWL